MLILKKKDIIIDLKNLQKKRDIIIQALTEAGYEFYKPQATFYIFVKSPIPDDGKFCEILREYSVLVLPGWVLKFPGYFRICLTANNDMVNKSLPYWKQALNKALQINLKT